MFSSSSPLLLCAAFLVGSIYYTMAIAWMFQNSLLPSVAPVHHRPGLSLASTALSNLGGAAFLIVQHRLLSAGSGGGSASPPMPLARIASSTSPVESSNPAIVPVASTTSAVVAAAAAHAADWHSPPSSDALHLVVLLGAAWWLVSAVPALLCMATLPAEPPPPELLSPTDTATLDLVDAPEHSGGGPTLRRLPEDGELADGNGDAYHADGDADTDEEAAAYGRPAAVPRYVSRPVAALGAVGGGGRAAAGGGRASGGGAKPLPSSSPSSVSFFAGLRRMRKHKHASRFVLSQVLYLTASTADGTSASAFAQEVVGLDVAAIVRLTMYAAFAGAAGSIATMGLARCFGARATLCCLMTLPPLLLVYSSCILVSETEFLVVGMIHAFVSGGVGFHGLNRGVFSQMVPKGREAEFFGVYFVSIKACSWMGPLVQAMLNELTGSLRLAVLSALAFYVPAVVCLGMTDFEEAKREAETGGATHRTRSEVAGKGDAGGSMNASALAAPSTASASSSADGPREKLLGATNSPASYGTC